MKTLVDIKKELLNVAGTILKSFYSDLVYDFEELDKLEYGCSIWIIIRDHGTNTRVDETSAKETAKAMSAKCVLRVDRMNVVDYSITEVKF